MTLLERHKLSRDQQKKLADDAYLLRAWRKWHREELDAALTGAHGALVAQLMKLLDQLELSSAAALLDFIRHNDWSSVDYATRLTVLHQINASITRLRERHGLTPIEDPLPGQPDNVFRVVRSILIPLPAHEHQHSPSEVATAERDGRGVTAANPSRSKTE
jgi:hypothetical protein